MVAFVMHLAADQRGKEMNGILGVRLKTQRSEAGAPLESTEIGNIWKFDGNSAAAESVRRHIVDGSNVYEYATAEVSAQYSAESDIFWGKWTKITIAAQGAYPFRVSPLITYIVGLCFTRKVLDSGVLISAKGTIQHSLFPDFEVFLDRPNGNNFQYGTTYDGPTIYNLSKLTTDSLNLVTWE